MSSILTNQRPVFRSRDQSEAGKLVNDRRSKSEVTWEISRESVHCTGQTSLTFSAKFPFPGDFNGCGQV